MSDRTLILERIRTALEPGRGQDLNELPDLVRPALEGGSEGRVRRFIDEVEAVSGSVHRVPDLDAASRALDRLIRSNEISELAVSRNPLARAISSRVIGQHQVLDPEDNKAALANSGMGLSGARLGIAEHGTLMLVPEDDHGRLVALLPPHHVAVLFVGDVVGTLAEAIRHLGEEPIPSTVTFVSGPSRTADIEQTLVIGIHGPSRVDIILIDGERQDGQS
jgi:L-lactate dehydrogenase complex protein LldG